MPSPLGHSLAGYIIYKAAYGASSKPQLKSLVLFLVVANLPDLDFIPGILVGAPNKYHHGISHGIGFTVLIALTLSLFLFFQNKEAIRRNFFIFFSLGFSHLILDYICEDTSLPYGLPLLWPFSDNYHIAPVALLTDIQRNGESRADFILSLLSWHNLWAIGLECILILPFLVVVLVVNRRTS